MLEFPEQDRIDIVFQSCVETMALGLFLIGLIPDPSVDERVADRIGDIMAVSLLGVPLLWGTGYACGNGCTFAVNGDAAKYVGCSV